jgi:hypothetical protein
MKITRIKSIPSAFKNFADAFNKAAEQIENAVRFSSMDGTVTINESDNGFDLSAKSRGGGGGLPDGYGPEEWTVYDGGVVTTRNFLTDNPD